MRIITSNQDVYKLALYLYELLMNQGLTKAAGMLEEVIEACWATSTEALQNHGQAFAYILQNHAEQLPETVKTAVEEAVKFIDELLNK
ncbi:hypothetical protein [Thermincola potens]|uniref:Adenylate cyclase n=1 Tax=Thermincola potens (strain JR) TaxID=635013 RepID=D5XER7_THEPJ|nr:hypothetical protein [Thermincola potens]ADG82138.1 adenylate cyclase [Thermincola potens JR]